MTPSADSFLARLAAADVRITLRGTRLDVDAPRGTLTPELLAELRRLKDEVVHALRLEAPCSCGATEFRDVPIHAGRSTRRDCSQCGRTKGFPRWAPDSRRLDP